jgi:4-aminobutyrate aminotransferase/(S)-3-amino-2-methylpropionate transaminase
MLAVLPFSPPLFTKGRGVYITDSDGADYLDVNCGQFCTIFGHSPEHLCAVMQDICSSLQDTSTNTLSVEVIEAAELLQEIVPEMNARTIFLSTGAEAVECALRYAKHLAEKPGVISFSRAYHGQTHGSAAYSMSRARIRPKLDFSYELNTPHTYIPALDHSLTEEEETIIDQFTSFAKLGEVAAFIAEPILSGGGFIFPSSSLLKIISDVCKDYGIFFILDECQTGVARTGDWFYYQKIGLIPDFLITGKGLGAGYPVSAVIVNADTVPVNRITMQHFSSHQNEPFAAALVKSTINYITSNNILQRIPVLEARLRNILQEISLEFSEYFYMNPRGVGLMWAFDLYPSAMISAGSNLSMLASQLCCHSMHHKLLLQHCNYGNTIRLLPSYLITEDELDILKERLCASIKSLLHSLIIDGLG